MMKIRLLGFIAAWLTAAGSAFGQPAPSFRPPVEIVLSPAEATATPQRRGIAYANGGVIDVVQPNPTTVIVTMSGLTAANADLCKESFANYNFDLTQSFSVVFNSPQIKSAKLTLEGQVAGLLRTNHGPQLYCQKVRGGSAEMMPGVATVTDTAHSIACVNLPARSADPCTSLSIYNHEGPVAATVHGGDYILHQTFGFGTTHPPVFARGASAEFSPQPFDFPDVYGFKTFRPFTGAATKNFGFQVTLKVIPDEPKAPEKQPKDK